MQSVISQRVLILSATSRSAQLPHCFPFFLLKNLSGGGWMEWDGDGVWRMAMAMVIVMVMVMAMVIVMVMAPPSTPLARLGWAGLG